MTVEKQFICDENKQPLWVVLSYSDWLKVEHFIERSPTTKPHRKRVSGLGMGQGVVIPDDFDDVLSDDFWLGEKSPIAIFSSEKGF